MTRIILALTILLSACVADLGPSNEVTISEGCADYAESYCFRGESCGFTSDVESCEADIKSRCQAGMPDDYVTDWKRDKLDECLDDVEVMLCEVMERGGRPGSCTETELRK